MKLATPFFQRSTLVFVVVMVALLAFRLSFLATDTSFDDQVLIVAGLVASVVLLAAVLALRLSYLALLIYSYLGTFYFANRALWTAWLGPQDELGAGSVAPLFIADGFLLLGIARLGVKAKGMLLLYALTITVPTLSLFWTDLYRGAAIYQMSPLLRVVFLFFFLLKLELSEKRIISAFRHISLIMAAMGFVTFLASFVLDRRVSIPGWGNNVLANALCVAVLLALWLHSRSKQKGLYLILVLCCLLGIVASGTRSALFVSTATVLIYGLSLLFPSRNRFLAIVSAGLLLTAIFLSQYTLIINTLIQLNPRVETFTRLINIETLRSQDFLTVISQDSSLNSRLILYRASWMMFLERPLFGVGWGQWNWLKSDYDVAFKVLLDPHNGFLWSLAEGGVVGFVLIYGTLFGLLLRFKSFYFKYMIIVLLVLELTNANLQKPLYGVLVALILALGMKFQYQEQKRSKL